MQIPDVAGYTLEDGQKILKKAGVNVQNVIVTSPPREKSDVYHSYYRILRIKVIDENMVQLMVARPL